MPERKAGKFRNRQFHIIGLRLTEDITIHSDPELTGATNDWLCLFPDGHFEVWMNADFMAEFVPVDSDAKGAVT